MQYVGERLAAPENVGLYEFHREANHIHRRDDHWSSEAIRYIYSFGRALLVPTVKHNHLNQSLLSIKVLPQEEQAPPLQIICYAF